MSKTVMGIGDPFVDYNPYSSLDGIGDTSDISLWDLLVPGALVGKAAAAEVQQAETTLNNFPNRPASGGGSSPSKTKRAGAAHASSSSHWPWIAAAVGAAALGFVVVRRMRRKKRGKRHGRK